MAATKQQLRQAARYIIRLIGGLDTQPIPLNGVQAVYYLSKHNRVKGVLDTSAGLLTLNNGQVIEVGRGRYIAQEFKLSS
jgi:hypothetical protein